MSNSYDNIEVKQKKKDDGKKETYFTKKFTAG